MPFPVIDFGGILTILGASDGWFDGFRALVTELASEGRVTPVSMAYVSLNWELFGMDTLGWQLLRSTLMVAAGVAAFALGRALGANRGAALIGATLFIAADSARMVWLVPQAFEHIAAILTIVAALAALNYNAAKRYQRRAIAIAALLVLGIWVREPMIAAVPFVVLLALMHRGNGEFTWPRLDRRALFLVASVGIAVVACSVVPVLLVGALARDGGYASRFGVANVSLDNARNVLFALLLPISRHPLFPANVLFLVVIAWAALSRTDAARRYRGLLPIALTLPLCAAAIYVMWPSFPGNYALPYLPALAAVFGVALSALWDQSRRHRAVAVVSSAVIVGYGILFAMNGRREYVAERALDIDVASAVNRLPADSRIVVAVDDPREAGGYGRALLLYTRAVLGAAPAWAADTTCDEAVSIAAAAAPDVVVLRSLPACKNAQFPTPTASLQREIWIRDWKSLRRMERVMSASLWHTVDTQPRVGSANQ